MIEGFEILADHLDHARAGGGGHAGIAGVHRGNRGGPREAQAHGLDDIGHGRGRAHGVAGAGRARHALLETGPFGLVDVAGLVFVPIFARMRAGADAVALVAIIEHRPGRHEDRRNIHAQRAHDEAGRRLVATAEQHGAINRERAQQLLGLHGEEIAVDHGGRLHQHLAEAHRRQFEGEAPRLQHAALHRLAALAQMRVAGRKIAPGVEDGDDRPPHEFLAAQPHLLGALAMAECAEIIGREPTLRAQRLDRSCHGRSLVPDAGCFWPKALGCICGRDPVSDAAASQRLVLARSRNSRKDSIEDRAAPK